MRPFRDDAELAETLGSLRPTPHPAFVAELDERAAAGFPRRQRERSSRLAGLIARIRSTPPRRLILPAGGVALTAIAAATVLVASNEGGSHLSMAVDHSEQGPVRSPETEEFNEKLVPGTAAGLSQSNSKPHMSRQLQPMQRNFDGSFGAAGGARLSLKPFSAPGAGLQLRKVERAAEIVLGTEPADVDDAAAKVFDAVHTYNGIVLHSSIEKSGQGRSGAEFTLLIPSAKLGDALATFSRIAEVRSRHDATADITAPTVSTSEHLRDSEARIDGLLAQLAQADTESERHAVDAELRSERRQAAFLRAQLANLDRRASLSRVSLRIDAGAGSTPAADDGSWGIGDALHDAGHIISVAAAVTLVGLAVLAPFAFLGLIAWLAHRTWLRRGRERALG
jgi:hypothetical protein